MLWSVSLDHKHPAVVRYNNTIGDLLDQHPHACYAHHSDTKDEWLSLFRAGRHPSESRGNKAKGGSGFPSGDSQALAEVWEFIRGKTALTHSLCHSISYQSLITQHTHTHTHTAQTHTRTGTFFYKRFIDDEDDQDLTAFDAPAFSDDSALSDDSGSADDEGDAVEDGGAEAPDDDADRGAASVLLGLAGCASDLDAPRSSSRPPVRHNLPVASTFVAIKAHCPLTSFIKSLPFTWSQLR